MADEIDYDNLPPLIPAGTSEEEREAILDKIAAGWMEHEATIDTSEHRFVSPAELRGFRLVDEDRGPIDLRELLDRCDAGTGAILIHGCDLPACGLSKCEIRSPFSVFRCRFSGKAVFSWASFSGRAEFHSARFSGRADFRAATFNGRAFFNWATFSEGADFYGARFSGPAYFYLATFSRGTDFYSARFSERADFESATFNGLAHFRSATFSDRADFDLTSFSGLADFVWASFSGPAAFKSVTFNGEAKFGSATFSELANFRLATFSGRADFRSATFSGRAYFHSATFSGLAHFRAATLSGPADFNTARFSEQADFGSATFSGPADFNTASFNGDTTLRHARFRDRAHFDDTVFRGELDARESRFSERASWQRVKLEAPAGSDSTPTWTFESAVFDAHAVFHGADLSDVVLRNTTLTGASLRELKHGAEAKVRGSVITWSLKFFRNDGMTLRVMNERVFGRRPARWLYLCAVRGAAMVLAQATWEPAFHPDGTALDGARLDIIPADNWTRLRRKFTGLNLTLNLAFLAIFVGGYAARAAMWLVAAKLGEPGHEQDADNGWYLGWLLVRFDEWGGNWWLPASAVALITYNAANFWVTRKVAALRDEEDRSGFTPRLREYMPLVTWSRGLWWARWVAIISIGLQGWDLARTIVYKPDPVAVRAQVSELGEAAADRVVDEVIDAGTERAAEAAAELRERVKDAIKGEPSPLDGGTDSDG